MQLNVTLVPVKEGRLNLVARGLGHHDDGNVDVGRRVLVGADHLLQSCSTRSRYPRQSSFVAMGHGRRFAARATDVMGEKRRLRDVTDRPRR